VRKQELPNQVATSRFSGLPLSRTGYRLPIRDICSHGTESRWSIKRVFQMVWKCCEALSAQRIRRGVPVFGVSSVDEVVGREGSLGQRGAPR